MLAWGERQNGLNENELRSVVAYIRQLGGNIQHRPETRPARWVQSDAALGERLFAANCAGCHGAKGVGNEGPALSNPLFLSAATDTFLVETIGRGRRGTIMQGFRRPSVVRPALTEDEIEAIVAYIRSLETK